MRFWEILSKTIFRFAARKPLQKIRANSLENVLKNSIRMIDSQTLTKMRKFVKDQQTTAGGFADKGGNCDLYYTLFGCFIAEALDVQEVVPILKKYVKNVIQNNNLTGVYLNSAIILYTKLFGYETLPSALQKKVNINLQKPENRQPSYSDFINLLTHYYLKDYYGLYQVQKRIRTIKIHTVMPCSVTAAHLVLQNCFGKPVRELSDRINSFYRKNGSFSALNMSPVGDLLSTGVALYALMFVNTDIRIIKPECLIYIDSLFSEGGFCATTSDTDPDVEYTFYGLLALGALSN
jgi:hypothetical protein